MSLTPIESVKPTNQTSFLLLQEQCPGENTPLRLSLDFGCKMRKLNEPTALLHHRSSLLCVVKSFLMFSGSAVSPVKASSQQAFIYGNVVLRLFLDVSFKKKP